MARLEAHPWPGNVRELKNVVERSLYRWPDPAQPLDEIILDPFASPLRPLPAAAPDPRPAGGEGADPMAGGRGAISSRASRSSKQTLLREALAAHGNNQRRTAQALGLGYHQLRHYLRKHKRSAPRSGG